jgi:hypothetical protein
MRVNIYALFGVSLLLSSLLLPWISVIVILGIPGPKLLNRISFGFSPLRGNVNVVSFDLQNITLLGSESYAYWFWWPTFLIDGMSYRGLLNVLSVLSGVSVLLLLYSLSLTTLCSFASGGWSSHGKRFLKLSSFMLGGSIVLWLLAAIITEYILVGINLHGNNIIDLGWMDLFGAAGLAYFNIGLYLSIAGIVAILIGSFRPKFINVADGRVARGKGRLDHWLAVPDKEKSTVLILGSLLPTAFFSIYFYILPSLNAPTETMLVAIIPLALMTAALGLYAISLRRGHMPQAV